MLSLALHSGKILHIQNRKKSERLFDISITIKLHLQMTADKYNNRTEKVL